MNETVTLKQVLNLAKQLSSMDKVRLIENITPQIKRELFGGNYLEHKSLGGLWREVNISEAEITQVREEMWSNFPREDI